MGSVPDDVRLPKVEIHVGELCNNRCSFCTTGWVNREKPEIEPVPRETIRGQLEVAYAAGARRALFQGGEPTLRRDLGDLIGDARAIGFSVVNVFTNARMAASRPGARWLAGLGVTWFQVSIQGGTAEMHDASVSAKGAFAQTIAGTRRLIALEQRVKINAVLTIHLLRSFAEFAERMIELRPEEIGIDLVSPSPAFRADREDYARLVPAMTPWVPVIVEGMRRMESAGLVVRLTNYPACLAPGIEHLVSAEAPTTHTHMPHGQSIQKILWRRSLQVKSDACGGCAYDPVCGGLYSAYAALHGKDELKPLAQRVERRPPARARVEDSALTRALRGCFGAASTDRIGVREVRRRANGAHELECWGPTGPLHVVLHDAEEGARAYARTEEFAISYEPPRDGRAADLRVVDAVVRALRRFEARWFASESDPEPSETRAG